MGVDTHEAARRGEQRQQKLNKQDPYAAVEYRVIDSPAFADLKPSAKVLLLLMARQLTQDNNNGHLQASFAWCNRYGIGSEHTLRSAIADLICHGFIYRTRSHGANRAFAKYAVTWKSIKYRDGLFLDGFVPTAWRYWKPKQKKSTPQFLPEQSGKNCSFTPGGPAETAGSTPAKTADYVLVPVSRAESAATSTEPPPGYGEWVSGYLARLAARGPEFTAACPVAVPVGSGNGPAPIGQSRMGSSPC